LRPQLEKIDGHFVPQYFTFATGAQPLAKVADLARISADGKSTDIVAAIGAGLGASPRDDAVVMLISDGQDNVSPGVIDAVRESKRKICTLVVGSEQASPTDLPNVVVDGVDCDEDFAVGHESKVVATIKSTALPNRLVEVKMAEIDAAGKTIGDVQIKQLVLAPTPKGQTVELTYKPENVGVHKLAVWIDPIPGERSTVDNRQEFQGLALDPRVRVLYIEGRLRPEYRYLNRALGHDPNIEESTLVRLQQDKFAAAGEGAGQELRALPTTLEEWKKFDVIILGDLDSSYLGAARQSAIEQAVSGGAGLMMIGGQANFGPGGYQGSPVEKALPVLVGDLKSAQETAEFVPQLTLEGQGHPALAGLGDWLLPPGGGKSARDLPPLRGNVVVGSARAGATVLLAHPGKSGPDGQPQIVLAVQRYGKGRSAAFTADTTYLWSLSLRDEGQDSPYNRFWGQIVRWLAGEDVRNRQSGAGLTGLLSKSIYRIGETARVRALVRDDKGDATQFAQVSMILKSAKISAPRQLALSPVASHLGMYQAQFPDSAQNFAGLAAGDYTVELSATKDGKELGRQELKFSVIPPDDELLRIAANPKLMGEIAETTGGFSGPLAELPSLLDQLIRTDPTATTAQTHTARFANTIQAVVVAAGADPKWPARFDLPMQGLLVAGLLVMEWITRRKWQLA
jgi:uncharacterized membrane protein